MTATGRMPRWLAAARRLHELKMETVGGCPCRTTRHPEILVPRLHAIEDFWGVDLPPSYAAFLLRYDGWPAIFGRVRLLNTAELLDESLPDALEQPLTEAMANHTLPGWLGPRPPADPVPIAFDPSFRTMFLLDPASRRKDGEMEIVAWFNELGVRLHNFGELMELVCDLNEHDVQQEGQLLAMGA